MRTHFLLVPMMALAILSTGCGGLLASIAAGSTIRVFGRAAPGMQRFRDIELAEAAMPASIAQMEGLLVMKPDNETLHMLLCRSYSSYGFGFLEDHYEEAMTVDDEETAEHYRTRASTMYLRARDLGLEMMSLWEEDDGGARGAMSRGIEGWQAYLREFDDEEQVAQLFWTAYAWARYINMNKDNIDALADLPFVNALAEHVRALDGSYYYYAPHALYGGLIGSAPAQVGGRPTEAKVEFDLAIQRTERKNLILMVMQAKIVAVALQDRALYRSLLEEVIAAGDVDEDLRLSNLIAKRRAERYLADIDNLFEPAAEGTEQAAEEGAEEGADGEPGEAAAE